MSRRPKSKRSFPGFDPVYKSYLVSLLGLRLLKDGKKNLAQRIIQETFKIIQDRTKKDPLIIFEKAVKNTSPVVELKAKRMGASTRQIPIEVSRFRATNLSLRWLVRFARERAGRKITTKLASELIDGSNGLGNAIRKKEEIHRMAAANKAFAHRHRHRRRRR